MKNFTQPCNKYQFKRKMGESKVSKYSIMTAT